VKKNIDFGEIGKGPSLTVAAIDAQMEALMSGDIDPLLPRESGVLARTGTEAGKEASSSGAEGDELVPAERPKNLEPPVDPFDAAMGSGSLNED
jgi:hypothetical protein